MKYLYSLIAITCLAACTSNPNTIVVPVNSFNITINGHTYNETSDASHTIAASEVVGKDVYLHDSAYPMVSLASLSVKTKNITTLFEGYNNSIVDGLGWHSIYAQNIGGKIRPYHLIDKGDNNALYYIDYGSTINITMNNAHQITGDIDLQLWSIPVNYTWSLITPMGDTQRFSMNLYNVPSLDTMITPFSYGYFTIKPYNVPLADTAWVKDTVIHCNALEAKGNFVYSLYYGNH